MLPIKRDILEIPQAGCRVHGRRKADVLSQCLVCGALSWSSGYDDQPGCACSEVDVAVTKHRRSLETSAA